MKIEFRCPPELAGSLPKPCLAAGMMPGWVRKMPGTAPSPALGGTDVRTVKHCPPFIDAMRSGILFPLAADVTIIDGTFSWDWRSADDEPASHNRSPIGVHVPEQATGLPGAPEGQFVIKFNNFWAISLPEGWSMMFGHPVNRTDLPFRTFTGQVDCDKWTDGFVHFPALWNDPDYNGVLKAGTPVAQGWPVRREDLELEFKVMDAAATSRMHNLQEAMQDKPGVYRKAYRAPR